MYSKLFNRRCWLLFAASSLTGCIQVPPKIYHWGGYETGVYERLVNTEHAKADSLLLETITQAEQQHLKVPPGAYAEYGYQLFKRGERENAVAYFEKERQLFPESKALMSTLIAKIKPAEKAADISTPEDSEPAPKKSKIGKKSKSRRVKS